MKRKEHLAGISVRKFVGQKKSEVIKRTLKDKSLKAAGRKRLERTMRGMAECFADVSKDRPRYFARFVKTWQAALDDIRASSERMLAGAATTLVDAELNMRQLADRSLRARAENIFRGEWTKYGEKTGADFILDAICEKLRSLQSASAADSDVEAVPLSNFEAGGPEEANPNALFPNGWFRKGQAMFLTSVAGSGKSVITTQLCYGWALGREVFGMKPFRPLTIGVIRPEDDDEEIAEFRDSMRRYCPSIMSRKVLGTRIHMRGWINERRY